MSMNYPQLAQAEWHPFTETYVYSVPQAPGVYWLGIASSLTRPITATIIYIGQSNNLQRRLLEHIRKADPCLSQANVFAYALHDHPEVRERQLLDDYARKNGGRLPRCNDRRG